MAEQGRTSSKVPDKVEEKVLVEAVLGDPDVWKVLCSVITKDSIHTTKYMNLPNGCLVQVSTQQRNPDGSYVLAESVTFVPGNTF